MGKNIIVKLVFILWISAFFSSCEDDIQTPYDLGLKDNWSNPIIPDNNPLTKESVAFGKKLFFDKRLSKDGTISCASCHKPEKAFADYQSLSFGIDSKKGFRNSGTLTNVAWLPHLNRDGGVKSLDIFSSVPLEDEAEMGHNLLALGKELENEPSYQELAKKIYNRKVDGFVITRALGSFLRTFISDESPYDHFLESGDSTLLTDEQRNGMILFFSDKAKCSTCHQGLQFTDYSFQNNGLYPSYKGKDRGRERITLDSNDEGKFRVATLRNIELTSPYMHDGSAESLEDVLDHYASNGFDHKNENTAIDSIQLNGSEKKAIISFLKSLTDQKFVSNPKFQEGQ